MRRRSLSKPKVYVTRAIPEVGLEKVFAACDAELWPGDLPPSYEILREKAADCDGLLSLLTDRIDSALMDASPRLKVVSNYAVGFNNIDIPAATERGIAVGHTPGVLTDATADMAFCLLISAARRVVEGHNAVLADRWKTWEPLGYIGQDLGKKTLGIVGMGRIGYQLAQRCRGGWGMEVVYVDRYRNEAAESELGAKQVSFEVLLAQSDFVSIHTDLNDETHHLFNAEAFGAMKKTAVFVNTARGPVVKQDDLVEALRSGEIFAAGLDVTDPEPPSIDDPLLQLPNVIVAPHIASATVQSRDGMAEIAADNLLAGLRGEPLRHCVNPEVDEKGRRS